MINAEALREFYRSSNLAAQVKRYSTVETALNDEHRFPVTSSDVAPRYFRAPMRMNSGGCHTDHQAGKYPALVLPNAIEEDIIIAVRPNTQGTIRVHNLYGDESIVVDPHDLARKEEEKGKGISLVRGLVHYLTNGTYSGSQGYDFVTHGEAKNVGSGLSSSAAYEVSLGTALNALWGLGIEPVQIAKHGQSAENNYYGKGCGLMDQAISACGVRNQSLLIGFTRDDTTIETVDLSMIVDQGFRLVFVNSGVSHTGIDHLYNEIKDDMRAIARRIIGSEDDSLVLGDLGHDEVLTWTTGRTFDRAIGRAYHWASENMRVLQLADAYRAGSIGEVDRIMAECAESCQHFLLNTRLPDEAFGEGAIEVLVDISRETDIAMGSSNFGGGFGGGIRAWVHEDDVGKYKRIMVEQANAKRMPNATAEDYVPAQGACEVLMR